MSRILSSLLSLRVKRPGPLVSGPPLCPHERACGLGELNEHRLAADMPAALFDAVSKRLPCRLRIAFARHHVAFDLRLQLGHLLAARHKIGDFLPALFALSEVRGLRAMDENCEVVANGQ